MLNSISQEVLSICIPRRHETKVLQDLAKELSGFVDLFFSKRWNKDIYEHCSVYRTTSARSHFFFFLQFCCVFMGRSRSRLEDPHVTTGKKNPVKISLKKQRNYSSGTTITCSHRGCVHTGLSPPEPPHATYSQQPCESSGKCRDEQPRGSSSAALGRKMTPGRSAAVICSYSDQQQLQMAGPGSQESASCNKKLPCAA